MIFKETWKQVLSGTKTQTRRIFKESYKYKIGMTYAVQPGRGKKSMGRIRINNIILMRLQDISNSDAISEGMIECPFHRGFYSFLSASETSTIYETARFAFENLWDSIYGKTDYRWEKNPVVFVLIFKLIESYIDQKGES